MSDVAWPRIKNETPRPSPSPSEAKATGAIDDVAGQSQPTCGRGGNHRRFRLCLRYQPDTVLDDGSMRPRGTCSAVPSVGCKQPRTSMTRQTETLSPAIPGEIESLTNEVLKLADAKLACLAAAESCTGGLFASLLTDVDGFAHCFERGFVCYSDRAKQEQLGVDEDLLKNRGAVSREVAIAMAQGALDRSCAEVAVAITGFAGRGAAGDEPGLVHFACAVKDGSTAHLECHFGDVGRGQVRIECLRTALNMMKVALA
jgi:nicotinamide-nucleotide amidase